MCPLPSEGRLFHRLHAAIALDWLRVLEFENTCHFPIQPPANVLQAFHLAGVPVSLAGGQSESLVLDGVVLKPTTDVTVTEWVCNLQAQLVPEANLQYPIAEPIAEPIAALESGPPRDVVRIVGGPQRNSLRVRRSVGSQPRRPCRRSEPCTQI
jgi:hypothetical protein